MMNIVGTQTQVQSEQFDLHILEGLGINGVLSHHGLQQL